MWTLLLLLMPVLARAGGPVGTIELSDYELWKGGGEAKVYKPLGAQLQNGLPLVKTFVLVKQSYAGLTRAHLQRGVEYAEALRSAGHEVAPMRVVDVTKKPEGADRLVVVPGILTHYVAGRDLAELYDELRGKDGGAAEELMSRAFDQIDTANRLAGIEVADVHTGLKTEHDNRRSTLHNFVGVPDKGGWRVVGIDPISFIKVKERQDWSDLIQAWRLRSRSF